MATTKKITYLFFIFLFFLLITFFLNRWVSNEMNAYKKPDPVHKQKAQKVSIHKIKTRKPVKIDPRNDPLAPVIKSRNNTQKVEKKRKIDPSPRYSKPEDNVILVQ